MILRDLNGKYLIEATAHRAGDGWIAVWRVEAGPEHRNVAQGASTLASATEPVAVHQAIGAAISALNDFEAAHHRIEDPTVPLPSTTHAVH
jgi:hypothetical protein